jgi:hypothetical protein
LKLSFESIRDLSNVEIAAKETVISNLPKKSYQCTELENLDFNTCSQNFLKMFFKENLTCSLPGLIILATFFGTEK